MLAVTESGLKPDSLQARDSLLLREETLKSLKGEEK